MVVNSALKLKSVDLQRLAMLCVPYGDVVGLMAGSGKWVYLS